MSWVDLANVPDQRPRAADSQHEIEVPIAEFAAFGRSALISSRLRTLQDNHRLGVVVCIAGRSRFIYARDFHNLIFLRMRITDPALLRLAVFWDAQVVQKDKSN
jgi:hypothetical protein